MFVAVLLMVACDKNRVLSEEELLALDMDADGWSISDGDCNDQDPAVFPDAEELCDGINNDCDATIDEGVGAAWFLDVDQDGFGDEGASTWSCVQPEGYVTDDGDCDDQNPDVSPEGIEVCNEVDDNCDGEVDEGVLTTWYVDADADGYGAPEGGEASCTQPPGTVDNDFDCDDEDDARNGLAVDICDGIDNDCDGGTDEDPELAWYTDGDGDGFGDDATLEYACTQPAGLVFYGGDCVDTDPTISPAATEVCDGVDNDCDARVDPDDAADAPTWHHDSDGDHFGDAAVTSVSCLAAPGYIADATDCDDADASISPAATEYCDAIDNDCDGSTDEDDSADASTWYSDVDSDGYGDAANPRAACSQPSGFVSDDSDCDDSRDTDHPGADEYCDSRDNDCDGDTDESGALDEYDWYLDSDADGFGDSSNRTTACEEPSGYVSDDSDCDDSEATTNPDAVEYCDSVDNDCDNSTDEDDAADASTWYDDDDGDGYGSEDSGTTVACDQPSGYGEADDDCDDEDSTISPGASEVCDDGIDDDCDGTADNGCPEEHCGNLSSDETWDSSVDHTITCNVGVRYGYTLTIEDGATIYMDPGTELQVGNGNSSAGTLVADGSTSGITFTSSASSPAAGDWERIYFSPAATNTSSFIGVTVEYGGDAGYGAVHVNGAVDVEDCTVTDSAGYGIHVGGSGDTVISGCDISNSGSDGVWVQGTLSTTGGPTFVNNTITTSGDHPVVVPAPSAGQIDATNTLTGNTTDTVLITAGTVTTDDTWALLDVDFQVEGDVDVHGSNIPTLTLEDGVALYFDPAASLRIGHHNTYYGGLDADGSSSGILFSSSESSPAAGDWDGITLGSSFYEGTSVLTGITVEYAGYTGYGGLRVNGSDVVLEDVTLQDNDVSGLYVSSGDVEVTGSTIQDNLGDGVYCLGTLGGEGAFTSNTVTGNDDYPIRLGPDAVKDLDATSGYTGNGSDYIYLRLGDGEVNDSGSWQALDVDYYLSQTLDVRGTSSPVLTLEDGVTIEFAAGQALQIGRPATGQSGGLVVEGSSTGVTMTSAASSPAAGDWDGLYFAKSTADSSTSVTGLTIEYAGDNGYGCVYMVGADITIEDSTVQDCSNSGIYADSLSAPLVSGSTIQDNEDYGVYAYDLGTTGGPTFANNTVTGNGVHPIRISASGWHQLDSSSAYTGNGDDYVLVGGGTISYAGTDVQLLDVDYEVVGDVTLSKGTAMSVQDGVTFYNGVGVRWTIAGALTATGGTGGITWTSAQATAAIGDWEGIVANNASGTGISLDNVTIEYGGDSLGANFYCSFSSPTLINSTIAYSSGYGIYQYYCGGTFTGNTYTSNQGGATN